MAGVHDGHRERMKKTFLERPDALWDHQLLELLLFYAVPRRDTNPMAHALLERFGSLSGVLDAPPAELAKVEGVGQSVIVLLKAAKELSGRYLASRTDPGEPVTSTQEAFRQLRSYFFGARSEKVCLLCMDGKGKNLGIRVVAEGNVNAAPITIRSVVENALALNATHVVLAHNHISGVALPSKEDIATTVRLYKVLESVDITLVDHLIFSDDDMVSMRKSGVDIRSGGQTTP